MSPDTNLTVEEDQDHQGVYTTHQFCLQAPGAGAFGGYGSFLSGSGASSLIIAVSPREPLCTHDSVLTYSFSDLKLCFNRKKTILIHTKHRFAYTCLLLSLNRNKLQISPCTSTEP